MAAVRFKEKVRANVQHQWSLFFSPNPSTAVGSYPLGPGLESRIQRVCGAWSALYRGDACTFGGFYLFTGESDSSLHY